MNTIDIRPVDTKDEELMQRLDEWVSRTEQQPGMLIPREASVFVMWHDTEIAAVYVFRVEPVVAMFFDRSGPAARTIRCFDLIRAVMQANGVRPLVFVDHASPLLEIAGKRMHELKDRTVYRM